MKLIILSYRIRGKELRISVTKKRTNKTEKKKLHLIIYPK